MAERKGLFSRLFGKKDTPAPIEEETLLDEATPLESAAPIEGSASLEVAAEVTLEKASPEDHHEVPAAVSVDEGMAAGTVLAPDAAPEQQLRPTDAAAHTPAPEITPAAEDTSFEPEPEPAAEPEEPQKKKGLFGRLAAGLSRTSQKLTGGIGAIFTKRKLDDETLEELEDLLISADLGLPATSRIIAALAKDKYDKEVTETEVKSILAEEIVKTLAPLETTIEVNKNHKPHIILMTGVNGAGKTTTIGKLAKKFSDQGLTTMLAAGDTFRAAAIEQLKVWGERTNSPVIAKEQGADAAGLAFDAIKAAKAQNIDVVLIDTAGRLQNRTELMDELAKIVRVIKKLSPDAPHDTVLVLDATVGQNALSQAQTFTQVAGVSSLIMTKLDGTARGGVLVALADKFALPISYIGVGEDVEDLQSFNANAFAQALTSQEDVNS